MNDYEALLAADRRLVVLRFLNKAVGHTANESVLETAVSGLGHLTKREDIRNDLEFLQSCGCVTIEWFEQKIMVAKLTRRGQYVVEGKEAIHGIKKPSLE